MKSSCILFLILVLAGCASSKQQQAKLTDTQATLLAAQLANKQATLLYHCQPFHDGRSADFTHGHWQWTELCSGDYEASVELAANGSTNSVNVYWLWDRDPMGLPGGVEHGIRELP